MNLEQIKASKIYEVVPQTFGEALLLYPWIDNPQYGEGGHFWDNRNTIENAIWLIQELQTRVAQFDGCTPVKFIYEKGEPLPLDIDEVDLEVFDI